MTDLDTTQLSPTSTPRTRDEYASIVRLPIDNVPQSVTHLQKVVLLLLLATLVILIIAIVAPYFATMQFIVEPDVPFIIGAFLVCSEQSYAGCQQLGTWSHDCAIVGLDDPPFDGVVLPDCTLFRTFRYALLTSVITWGVAFISMLVWLCRCTVSRSDRVLVGVKVVLCVAMGMACVGLIIALGSFTEWATRNGVWAADRGYCFSLLAASLPLAIIASVCCVVAIAVPCCQRTPVMTARGISVQQTELVKQ
jgi:hypothetical protein